MQTLSPRKPVVNPNTDQTVPEVRPELISTIVRDYPEQLQAIAAIYAANSTNSTMSAEEIEEHCKSALYLAIRKISGQVELALTSEVGAV